MQLHVGTLRRPDEAKNLENTVKFVQADDMCVSLDSLHEGLLRQASMRKSRR